VPVREGTEQERGEEGGDDSAERGDSEGLDQELAEDGGAAGADGDADAELAGTVCGACGEEAAEVGAGGDEDEQGKEHDPGEEGVDGATEQVADKANRRKSEREGLVLAEEVVGEGAGDSGEVGVGLLGGDAGCEPGDDPGVVVPATFERAEALDLGLVLDGDPELGPEEALGSIEVARSDSDDDVGVLVDEDGLANDLRRSGEADLPGGEAEDDDRAAVDVGVFARHEEAAEEGLDAKGGEVVAAGLVSPDGLGVAGDAEANAGDLGNGDAGEAVVAVAKVAIVGVGDAEVARLFTLDLDDLTWFGDGEGMEDQGVEDAEDDEVRGDRQGEGKDGREGKAGGTAQLAKGEAHVAKECVECRVGVPRWLIEQLERRMLRLYVVGNT